MDSTLSVASVLLGLLALRTLHVLVVLIPYINSHCFSDVNLPGELNARLVVGPALNCEDLDSALHGQTVWRGGLETFVAQDQTFKRISHATGMELVAKDSASFNR